jgi:undecaprenyl diphosphate synthase
MPQKPELPEKLPQHVAIIMDGNGRWAKGRGKVRLEGHKEGTDRVLEIARACREWGIRTLTLYAFSTENWKRPEDEVGGLMVLLRDFLRTNRAELIESGTRLHTLGDLTPIPAETRAEIEETLKATRHLDKHVLNIALNYGSRAEILRAVRGLAEAVKNGELQPEQIDEAALEAWLYTAGQPDPDLMIRTSGEQRISNYLLWQLAYSELIFTPVSWPEFGRKEFAECLRAFGNRERRFGMTGEQIKAIS